MFNAPGKNLPDVTQNNVYHIDEINEEIASEAFLGRKGLSLYKLHSFDVPIPEFFVVPPKVFSSFVKKVLDEKGSELLKSKNPEPREILNSFHRFDFDDEIKAEILKEYTKLSGFSDAWVSVRSSVSATSYPEISFSGVFATELNIRGFNNVLRTIKTVYASMFTDSAVMYAVREGVELADVKLAVVVQKMVHSEVSGTCFTLDPVTLTPDNMSVEAVFGLGDVIANGEITPDSYQLSKKKLEIYEKHISPQEWMKVRSLNNEKGGFEKISISPAWSHRQKLEDKYISEVAKISLLIEDKVGENVDVEWVISSGRVYVLQYKPAYTKESYLSHHVQYGGYSYVANSVGQVISELMGRKNDEALMVEKSMHEAQVLIQKEANSVAKEDDKAVEEVVKSPDLAIQTLTSGIGVSFGNVTGKIKVLKNPLEEVSKENILLISDYESIFAPAVIKSGGVICAVGSLTSELSILCREFGIPAIVGVVSAFELLNDGDTVQLDGNSGSLYMIDKVKVEKAQVAKEIIEKKAEYVSSRAEAKMEKDDNEFKITTATKIFADSTTTDYVSNSDGVVFIDLDKIILSFGKHPSDVITEGVYKKYAQEVVVPIVNLATKYAPSEVVVVIGKGTSAEFEKIAKRENSENSEERSNSKGAKRYLSNKKCLDVAVRLIRRIRNINHCRNVSLGVYAPQGGTLMKEMKKEISARGLRRGSSFNIYAVVENPAEIILSDDILDAEIDGIILDTPTLARHVFNLPMAVKDVVYDLSAGSIFRILDAVSTSIKTKGKKLIVLCEDNKELVKYAVSKGVYGIVVESQYMNTARKLVSDAEAKIILSVK